MWLYVPQQFCPSAPEPADSTSDSEWLFRAAESSLTWNGKPSLSRYWKQRWRTASWTRRLFGAISPPSTASPGVESWIASLRESRASHTPRPVSGSVPTTNETSGRPRPGSLVKSSPVSSSWSRLREDYGITSTESGQSFEQWASSLRRDYSQRKRSALPTDAGDSSSWPTPNAGPQNDSDGNWEARRETTKAKHGNNGFGLTLGMAVTHWPTATASDGERTSTEFPRGNPTLRGEAVLWPTATATDGEKESIRYSKGDLHLSGAARLFPTPSVSDVKGWDGPNKANGSKRWDAYSRLVQQTSKPGHVCSTSCRLLNPLFVEMLMGWPGGWTLLPLGLRDYEFSVMEWSRWSRLMRFSLLRLGR